MLNTQMNVVLFGWLNNMPDRYYARWMDGMTDVVNDRWMECQLD